MKQLLTFLLLFCWFFAGAETYTLSANGPWNDANTWTNSMGMHSGWPGSNPPNLDDVIIGTNAYTVTLHGDVTINSLTFNGSELATYITASSTVKTLTISTYSTWSGGDISGTAQLIVPSSVTLALNSNEHKSIHDNAKVINNGIIEWNGGGIFFYGSAEFRNNNVFNDKTFDNKLFISTYTGTQVFTNNGTFNCTSTVGLLEVSIKFVNAGTLNVNFGYAQFLNADVTNTGTINLNSATTCPNCHTLYNFTGTGGTINFGTNTTLKVRGTSVLGSITGSIGSIIFDGGSSVTIGSVIPSGITLDLNSTGTITLNVNQTLNNSTTISKDISGSGTLTLQSGKTFTWNQGKISGGAELIVGGTVNLETSSSKTVEGTGKMTINPGGIVNYSSSGGFGIGGSALFQNNGTFNIEGDPAITDVSPGGSSSSMTNAGSLNKTSGSNSSRIEPYFTNSSTGNVSAQSGTIEFLRNLTNSGTLKGTGTIKFASSQPSFPGTIAPGLSPGTLTFTNANSIVPTGTLQVEVDGSSVDMLVVSGNLNITGTGLVITEINSLPEGSYFTIVRSLGGTLTSPFSSVTKPSNNYSLVYTTTEVRILNGILPVELTTFTAQPTDTGNHLHWETASEQNAAWHIVERSSNGSDWVEIGRMLAAGTSQETHVYDFTDASPLPVNYYRLRSLDQDGSFEYSKTIVLESAGDRLISLNAYPNPVDLKLNVEINSKEEQDAELLLADQFGRILHSEKFHAGQGLNSNELIVSDLPAGIYFVEIKTSHSFSIQKIVKE